MSFSDTVKDFIQVQKFIKIYNFLIKNGLMPEADKFQVMDMVAHLYERGWLYYGYENDKIVAVVGLYRVKDADHAKTDKLPDKEEGDVLYVEFSVSVAEDKHLMRKMLGNYCQGKDIKKMVFYKYVKDGEDKYTEMPVRTKGEKENEEETEDSRRTTVLQ